MKYTAILVALLVVVGAAVALDSDDDRPDRGAGVALGEVRLVSVQSCDELLDWYRQSAAAIDAGGLGGFGFGRDMVALEDSAAGAARSAAPTAGAAEASADTAQSTAGGTGGGDGSFSGTNVQETGVDEPDTVKTDGEVLVHAGPTGIDVVDVGDGEPRVVGRLALEQGGTELLLAGDRVLALTNAWRERGRDEPQPAAAGREMMIAPVYGEPVTVLTAIDISDPSSPTVVATTEIDGSYRSARLVGSTVRIVLTSTPQLPMPDPAVYEGGSEELIQQRLEAWKDEAIASMTLEDWVPTADGDQAVACDAVSHPAQPSGISTTTVLTLDVQGSLERLDEDAVVADAGTVYASTDRLYVATSQWAQTFAPQGGGSPSTQLHAFDISDPATTTYLGSGGVPGYLLNQFSLSARDGNIRVATTQQPPWDPSRDVQESSSSLAVLAERDAALVEIGRVDGLGPTEQIHAVRYVEDVAYVVTFRQTDPLYVIDLSDPTAPRTAGELKIPGFSRYLHPIDDDRLLGVGQDATDEGQTLGTQVSTFDVGDAASPTRIDALRIDGGSSSVEWDHRAFLWWAGTRTAVVPVEIYEQDFGGGVDCPPDAVCTQPSPRPSSRPFMGAVAFGIDDAGAIVELGRVSHAGRGADPNNWWAVSRSFVVGDALYTVSEAGVLKSDLASLADEGFAQFPPIVYDDRPMPVDVGAVEG